MSIIIQYLSISSCIIVFYLSFAEFLEGLNNYVTSITPKDKSDAIKQTLLAPLFVPFTIIETLTWFAKRR
jgi:F0F1-type ATP synthase membrane subunit a